MLKTLNMTKKSQVTIFVIFVIVVLIISGFLFYSTKKTRLDELKLSENTNLKEISPIKIYIENVIRNLMVEGMFTISKQGGLLYESAWPACKKEDSSYTKDHRMCNQSGIYDYNSYPEYLAAAPYKYQRVHTGINDGREETITRTSFENLVQPFSYPHVGYFLASSYLYGMNQPLPVITGMTKPQSLEFQLSNFTSTHLPSLLDFTEFERMGYDIEVQPGHPRVTLKINEEDVTARVYYNVTIQKAGIRYEYDEFFVDIDYNFRRLYLFVQKLIQADMTTLQNILAYKMMDEKGDVVGEVYWLESNPITYEWDMIYVIDRSYDFNLMHNYKDPQNPEPEFMTFYFIRENRASDASTVYFSPPNPKVGEEMTWYCPNFQTNGQWFDPDEDDMYTNEFVFKNPSWYVFKSRGDYLEYNPNTEDCSGVPYEPELKEFRHRTTNNHEEDSVHDGISFLSEIQVCGNQEYEFKWTPKKEDVSDIVILTVGDQMDFSSGETTGPSRYPEGPISEPGTERLNDVISFKPVRCNPSEDPFDCCDGEWWRLDKPSDPPRFTEEKCTEKCNPFVEDGDSDPETCGTGACTCLEKTIFYKHCDHKGELQESNHRYEVVYGPERCPHTCSPKK